VKSEFVHGYRVTAAASAKIVDRVLSREINPGIVKAIEDFGGKRAVSPVPRFFAAANIQREVQRVKMSILVSSAKFAT